LCKWQIVQQNNKIYKIWWKTKLIPWHHTVLWNHLSDDTGTSIDWECIKWSHTTCERTVSITLNSSHSYSILLIKFISQTFFKVYTFSCVANFVQNVLLISKQVLFVIGCDIKISRYRRGRDCMVVGFTTAYAISSYHN
jgi:hypothetical protein